MFNCFAGKDKKAIVTQETVPEGGSDVAEDNGGDTAVEKVGGDVAEDNMVGTKSIVENVGTAGGSNECTVEVEDVLQTSNANDVVGNNEVKQAQGKKHKPKTVVEGRVVRPRRGCAT